MVPFRLNSSISSGKAISKDVMSFAFTSRVSVALTSGLASLVTTIVALPALFAVTRPNKETLATFSLEEE